MKNKALIFGVTAATLITPAFADVIVDITGATAFRAACLTSIKASFDAAPSASYQFAHNKAEGDVINSDNSLWVGKFPGITGTTTIRCTFNGSVQGIRALVDSPAQNPSFYDNTNAGNLITAASSTGGETHKDTANFAKAFVTAQAEIAFSDVAASSTPFSAPLQPADPAAGVVVFTMLTNQGSSVANVTTQNFRALFGLGKAPLSQFTGDPANSTFVYAVGRNDGSGTRTAYLAETGFGIANPVVQYIVNEGNAGTDENTVMQVAPVGGVNVPALNGQDSRNKSTVWGQDQAGNGGYNSGSGLVTAMGRKGTSVQILDEDGGTIGTNRADLVTWISLNDAITARDAGAVFCAYNGYKLNDVAVSGTTMSAADLGKVTHGAYTAWSYQQMYRRNDLTSGDVVSVYNTIKAAIQGNLATAGVPVTSMAVSRDVDGGVVGSTSL